MLWLKYISYLIYAFQMRSSLEKYWGKEVMRLNCYVISSDLNAGQFFKVEKKIWCISEVALQKDTENTMDEIYKQRGSYKAKGNGKYTYTYNLKETLKPSNYINLTMTCNNRGGKIWNRNPKRLWNIIKMPSIN